MLDLSRAHTSPKRGLELRNLPFSRSLARVPHWPRLHERRETVLTETGPLRCVTTLRPPYSARDGTGRGPSHHKLNTNFGVDVAHAVSAVIERDWRTVVRVASAQVKALACPRYASTYSS